MQAGQRHKPPIPFWCTLLAICCAAFAAPGCSNRSQEAAQEAALAQRALNSNDLPAARRAIIAALADRDDIADYHILRGRIEFGMGSLNAAYNAYSNALALDPTNMDALLQVAQLGLTTGNLRGSLDAAEQALELDPNQVDALLIRGIHSMVEHNYDEAITYADKILARSPGQEGASILKARALYTLHQSAEALATLDNISGGGENSQVAALTRLEIYRAERRPREMLAQFERLRHLQPNDPDLALDEANVRYKLGQRALGEALVEKVLANPASNRAAADQAIALWREYGSSDVPGSAIVTIGRSASDAGRIALVRYLVEAGRGEDAAKTYAQISKAPPAGLKARLLLLNGDGQEAGKLAATILAREKTDCDALVAAAGSAISRSSAQEALRLAQQASSECPAMVDGWFLAAQAYEVLGGESGASGVSRVYRDALDANKQSERLTAAYARWLVSQKRTREAVAAARRLTRYAPALLSGWRLYADLCQRFDQSCVSSAATGLANAATLFGVDLEPGQPPPNGLLGRFVTQ
jgi:tetratricopeptide (TPR) repeat protein